MDINAAAKAEVGRLSMGGKEGRKEGTFRTVIGAREVISDLKSSRCGPGPEKEKKGGVEMERIQERGQEKEGDLTGTGLLPL